MSSLHQQEKVYTITCRNFYKISSLTLRKQDFHFLVNLMGYDCGDSFPFAFEPNGNLFGSKVKVKLSSQSYPIKFERKWKSSFLGPY